MYFEFIDCLLNPSLAFTALVLYFLITFFNTWGFFGMYYILEPGMYTCLYILQGYTWPAPAGSTRATCCGLWGLFPGFYFWHACLPIAVEPKLLLLLVLIVRVPGSGVEVGEACARASAILQTATVVDFFSLKYQVFAKDLVGNNWVAFAVVCCLRLYHTRYTWGNPNPQEMWTVLNHWVKSNGTEVTRMTRVT